VLSTLCTDRAVPIWGKPEDGNASDKTMNTRSNFSITPGVLAQLTHSLAMGWQYAETVFGFVGEGRIQVISLTSAETTFRDSLPDTLGAGERESIAVAKERQGTVVSVGLTGGVSTTPY
jgi:hypothetical protein